MLGLDIELASPPPEQVSIVIAHFSAFSAFFPYFSAFVYSGSDRIYPPVMCALDSFFPDYLACAYVSLCIF